MSGRRAGRRLALALVLAACGGRNVLAAGPELLGGRQAFRLSASADAGGVTVRYRVADGYYLYRDKFRFALAPATAGSPVVPKGVPKDDEHFGRVETLRGEVVVRIPLRPGGGSGPVTLTATSQGCADAGVCYPPQTETLILPRDGAEVGVAAGKAPPSGRSLIDALGGKP